MIIESSLLVGFGLLLTFLKLDWRKRMWMLSHPVTMDIGVFGILLLIHWGTFYGTMAATGGALMCSAVLGAGRWLYGYCSGRVYHPGLFNVAKKLV